MVIRITEMVSSVLAGIPTPRPTNQSTSNSEKLSAAKALPRKPDNVMATWIVAKNRAGCTVSLRSRAAFRLPSAAIRSSLVSFTDSTAISAQAKTALRPISKTCSRSCHKISYIVLCSSSSCWNGASESANKHSPLPDHPAQTMLVPIPIYGSQRGRRCYCHCRS